MNVVESCNGCLKKRRAIEEGLLSKSRGKRWITADFPRLEKNNKHFCSIREKRNEGGIPLWKKVTPLLFLHRHEKPLDFSTPSRVSICNKKGLSKNIAKKTFQKFIKKLIIILFARNCYFNRDLTDFKYMTVSLDVFGNLLRLF